jgi:N-acetyl-anhydromuramyl-L-alanine amidase AmpD
MVLGELTQDDAQRPRRNFIEMATPDLMEGKTLAESLIGDTLVLSIDDAIIYGDPTFHYNFSGIKDKSKHIYYKELKNNLNIVDKFISWGYKMPPSNRSIDTIIIHSSYDALGTNPYSVEGVIYEYKIYGVTPHYLIDRNGTIFRLVKEENIAYHAGKSKMPDGRENVNNFSIGIELIYKKDEQPNEIQYISLCNLVKYLKSKYKIKYLLGHNHIAPDRKTDPWNFDWQKFNEMLKIRTL